MEDQMIQETIRKAVNFSKEVGHCYILTNGQELKTAFRFAVPAYKEQGFWVAAIYEHGHPVEA